MVKDQINPNLPIRPTDKFSPKDGDEARQDFEIFISQYEILLDLAKSNSYAREYLDLLLQWTEDNNDIVVKEMKRIEKLIRLESSDYVLQSVLTFHRAYNFHPKPDKFNKAIVDYVTEYMSDDKFYSDDIRIPIQRSDKIILVERFLNNVKKMGSYRTPSVSLSKSPMGPKKNDYENFTRILSSVPIAPEVVHNVELLNSASRILNLETFSYQESNMSFPDMEEIHQLDNLRLTPKMTFIPNPGKLRPIFISNDIYDVILDPFRKIVKMFTKGLSSSYNSKRVYKDKYLNVDLPTNIRETYDRSQSLLGCGLVNSDLSSATDKLYSGPQNNLLLDLIELSIEMDIKNGYGLMARLETILGIQPGYLLEYVRICLYIISDSYVSVSFESDGNHSYGFLKPKFGQCQGQRGSFDLLHLTHTAVCLAAIRNTHPSILSKDLKACLPFCLNGDDGAIPSSIVAEYSAIWESSADAGIRSDDKSTTEESDVVEFCKQYVRINRNERQPLNGLRYPTIMKMARNLPLLLQMEDRYDQSDLWKQIRLTKSAFEKRGITIQFDSEQVFKVPQDRVRYEKARSLMLEVLARRAILMSQDEGLIQSLRAMIDSKDSPYNVFDRERILPDEDHSDAYDWLESIGVDAVARKYGYQIGGSIPIDLDITAARIALGERVPSDILLMAMEIDKELYLALENLHVENPTRRSVPVKVNWSIEYHGLLIKPEYNPRGLIIK